MAAQYSCLEEPGGLQSMGSRREGRDWAQHNNSRKAGWIPESELMEFHCSGVPKHFSLECHANHTGSDLCNIVITGNTWFQLINYVGDLLSLHPGCLRASDPEKQETVLVQYWHTPPCSDTQDWKHEWRCPWQWQMLSGSPDHSSSFCSWCHWSLHKK